MPKIRTVLGDKDPAEMGHILPHEHTFFHLLGAPSDPASVFDREKAVEEGAAQFKAAGEEFGISGLVDWAPSDLGRDMGLMVELSRASGWDIVACTGIFGAWGYPAYWEAQSTEAIEDFFMREIEEGAVDEGVRCGIIKVGTRLQPHERPIGPNAPLEPTPFPSRPSGSGVGGARAGKAGHTDRHAYGLIGLALGERGVSAH